VSVHKFSNTQFCLINAETQRCCLCTNVGGAVVRCCDCTKEFHVSCAWTAGHRFGFEIQAVCPPKFCIVYHLSMVILQVKHSKRDQTTMVQWNGDSGNMVPVICCKEHSSRRIIHEICETNDVGEVRSIIHFVIDVHFLS
jgi:hypothetical protein